jgi:glutamyl-tRNA synthetase
MMEGPFHGSALAAPLPVVGRLAPSPTGLLHLGHAFSLLVAWWQARSSNGRVILRLDDIDAERAKSRFSEQIIFDLRWLGIDWDDAPVIASERRMDHQRAANQLLEQKNAYPCVCSRRDVLRALGAPHQGDQELRYPETCRGRFSTLEEAETQCPDGVCLRFLCPPGIRRVKDLVFGWYEEDVAELVGDFVIQRRALGPAYQLSVVVDDHMDGVTHVVRGRDLLPSTLRQNLLAEALGVNVPDYLHVPLICDPQGRRLAKRDNDLSLSTLREIGVSPEMIATWAARCAGQPALERPLSAAELAERFDEQRLRTHDVLLPDDPLRALELTMPIKHMDQSQQRH